MSCHETPGLAPGWAGPVSVGLDPCRKWCLLPIGRQRSLTSGQGASLAPHVRHQARGRPPPELSDLTSCSGHLDITQPGHADGLRPARWLAIDGGRHPRRRMRQTVAAHSTLWHLLTSARGYAASRAHRGECLAYRSASAGSPGGDRPTRRRSTAWRPAARSSHRGLAACRHRVYTSVLPESITTHQAIVVLAGLSDHLPVIQRAQPADRRRTIRLCRRRNALDEDEAQQHEESMQGDTGSRPQPPSRP